MSIVLIKGASQTGKSLIANALRNHQISNQSGALLIDESNDGNLRILVEKLIIAEPLPDVVPSNWADTIPFKKNPMIILVGNKDSFLQDAESLLPGFIDKFGPIYTVDTGIL